MTSSPELPLRRHPDRVAELVELDAAMAEPLLFSVVAHLLGVVTDLV